MGRPPKEPEEGETSQEQTNELFISEFHGLQVDQLKSYEQANRQRIKTAPFQVKDAFDQKWTKETGGSYFAAVTDRIFEAPKSDGKRIDPKSRGYKQDRLILSLRWEKQTVRRKVGKEEYISFEQYNIYGTDKDGDNHHILINCHKDSMAQSIGDEIAQKIIEASKSGRAGVIKDINAEIPCEGFWEVTFHPRTDPNQMVDVVLSCNEECLQILREYPVVMAGRFLEAADNTTYPVYVQKPGETRKQTGKVQHFPYTPLREARKSEFIEQRSQGTRLVKKERADALKVR